jgi:hypothetical protein
MLPEESPASLRGVEEGLQSHRPAIAIEGVEKSFDGVSQIASRHVVDGFPAIRRAIVHPSAGFAIVSVSIGSVTIAPSIPVSVAIAPVALPVVAFASFGAFGSLGSLRSLGTFGSFGSLRPLGAFDGSVTRRYLTDVREVRRGVRNRVRRKVVTAALFTAAATAPTTATPTTASAIFALTIGPRALFVVSGENGFVVVFLVSKKVGGVRGELGPGALVGVGSGSLLFGFELREAHVHGLGAQTRSIAHFLGGELLEGGGAIGEPLVDEGLIPFAKREHPGLHAYEGILFVGLFDQGCQSRSHRHFGTFAHVTQEVLLDGYVCDLFVM